MPKEHFIAPALASHRKQMVVREVILLLAITFVALLLQAGGHKTPVLVLDVGLISGGLIGLLAAIFMRRMVNRWWVIALSAVAAITGAIQLFWSSGMAVGFLVLVAVLPVGDALANVFILGRDIWLDYRNWK